MDNKENNTPLSGERVAQVNSVDDYNETPENAAGLLADIDIFRVLKLPNEAINRINLFVSSHTAPLQSRIAELESENAKMREALEGIKEEALRPTDFSESCYIMIMIVEQAFEEVQALKGKEAKGE